MSLTRGRRGRAAAQLCRLLDGLPLALELAAARVGSLGLAEIVARLAEGQQVLRHPGRTAPARHQTLDATLEWSYRLLSRVEQALFRRLSVFQGSFSLLAAEPVASGAEVEPKDVVELLAALVDKSLVQVAGRGLEHRYRLLNTVQHYAQARLEESVEFAAAQRAHGEFYLALAEQARAGLDGADQSRWLQRLALEHDNLSAALARQLPAGPETGGRLAAMLWPYWYRRGSYQEARCWLEQATQVGRQMSDGVRADVLTGAGVLAFLQCDYQTAAERLRQAHALYERQGHLAGTATTLQRLGAIAREQGQYAQARRLHQQSLAAWSELGDAAGSLPPRTTWGSWPGWRATPPRRSCSAAGRWHISKPPAGARRPLPRWSTSGWLPITWATMSMLLRGCTGRSSSRGRSAIWRAWPGRCTNWP